MNLRLVLLLTVLSVSVVPGKGFLFGNPKHLLAGAWDMTKKFWGVTPEDERNLKNTADKLVDRFVKGDPNGLRPGRRPGRHHPPPPPPPPRGSDDRSAPESYEPPPSHSPQKCYAVVGCFKKGVYPWNRRGEELPQSPDRIGLEFRFYNRDLASTSGRRLEVHQDSIEDSGYDGTKVTMIIVHGMHQGLNTGWIREMRRHLLYVGDFNIIVVGWKNGARPRNVFFGKQPAVANVRYVGAMLGKLYDGLAEYAQADMEQFHCIGHNMGAHVCGEFGTRVRTEKKRLGRISGLDPVGGSGFDGQPRRVRLDPTDAWFVDVIHTDTQTAPLRGGGGMGSKQQMGHVDFYPNGGYNQPGCSVTDASSTLKKNMLNCGSTKAAEFYIESIYDNKGCQLIGIPCDGEKSFNHGYCRNCGKSGCVKMGFRATDTLPKFEGKPIKYYLNTRKEKSYCQVPYHVFVKVQYSSQTQIGALKLIVHGDRGSSHQMRVKLDGSTYDADKAAYRALVYTNTDVGKPSAVTMNLDSAFTDGLHVKGIVVTNGYANEHNNGTTSALFLAGPDNYLKSHVSEDSFVTRYTA